MIEGISEATLTALIGMFGGVVLGLAARLSGFCALGAIEDALYAGSRKRMAMWGVAIGVAVLGAFGLQFAGQLDFESAIYHSQPFSPTLTIFGGLLFGYGMSLAGNCGFGALARLGGGDLRSFVIVLVIGVSAYITLSGPLAAARVFATDQTAVALPAGGYAGLLEMAGIPFVVTGFTIGGLLLLAASFNSDLIKDKKALMWSLAVGLTIVAGWAGTQWISETGFSDLPVRSHTYAAPIGESLIYVMTASGGGLGFGVGSVAGVIIGATMGSLIKGQFRWEACEDPRELRRQIFGAAAMGVGAVLAFGCTIGQGISAFSVLAYSAPFAVISIIVGASLGLKFLIAGHHSLG